MEGPDQQHQHAPDPPARPVEAGEGEPQPDRQRQAPLPAARLIQQQNPELQIVATSHSPYLLDYVKAEEVLLTSLDQDGYAVVKSLTEHPEYERWKDLMAPGEFWRTVGESWVTEQQVAK
jgi:hypothetical protein